MKFRLRADPEDITVFIAFAIFLLFVVCLAVTNLSSLASTGQFAGLNPFLAFAPQYIAATIALYIVVLIGLFASVSSMFIEREEGFGFTTEKKSKGYSRWSKEKEIKEELEQVSITQKDAQAAGIPILLNEKEMWVDNGDYHSLVIGATGSGKTQTVVFPMVYSLAKARESMVLTDPKGELYEKSSNMLRSRGYQILLLNFRDPQKGNAWNPMSLPYEMYKAGNQDKAIELLDDLALNILYDESNKSQDPFWEKTSADYFSGIALGLFEDAKPEEININSISLTTTVGEEKFGGSNYIKEYFAEKDPSSAAAINASATITAPSETKGGILSVFRQKIKLFASRENLSEMLSYSDIDLKSIGKKPTAVFIVIQDEKKTYHSLVTILLKQIYETLISVAQESEGGRLPVRTNFILDEFANMPPLKDVTTMITAARSRKIRFTMIIQNFAQLDSVYGKEDAETIRGNCGNIVYLITTELKALEEISKMCGEVKSKKEDKTASTPLVTVSDLQRMKPFEVIIMRLRKQPFKTKFTPFFKIDWGKKYPLAKYPVRNKRTLHVFDIKEFVKNQKKKKLLDMMNSSQDDNESGGINPSPFPSQRMIREDKEEMRFPDFLSKRMEEEKEHVSQKSNSYNPFDPFNQKTDGEIPKPSFDFNRRNYEEEDDDDDGIDIDIDELARKIDAKIAELEEEQRKEENNKDIEKLGNEPIIEQKNEVKEELPKIEIINNSNSINTVIEKQEKINKEEKKEHINLDLEEDEDDDFFDDFFDN